jgi:hypothetical protein
MVTNPNGSVALYDSSSKSDILHHQEARVLFYSPRRLSMQRIRSTGRPPLIVLLLLLISAAGVEAQSLEISAPAPVTGSDLAGRIRPRDIGDARYTDHYYAFVGNPGDLIVTVTGQNLNGDVDIFTSVGLRPLLKFTLYAESSTPITKSTFLRNREQLILRIEARTPNDDNGLYRITFAGTFEALPQSLVAGAETEPGEFEISSSRQTGRRVSSVGARIYEPEPVPKEVAAAPTPEATTEATPTETPEEKPAEAATIATEPERPPARTTPPRRGGRRSRSRQPAAGAVPKVNGKSGNVTTGRTTTSSRNSRSDVEQPVEPEPEVGPRLVIETADGTLIDKSMTTVRRVMIENGWVVVVGKDGRVQRIMLSQVVKMSIAP